MNELSNNGRTTADEVPQVKIGDFVLSKGISPLKIWIGCESGEGGNFDEAELSKIIGEYYSKNL